MTTQILTYQKALHIFNYSPHTGAITNKITRGIAKVGREPGGIDDKGYRVFGYKNRIYKAHRVAWLLHTGAWPSNQIDHINGIKSDNRIDNLRDISNKENGKNSKRRSDNTSGVTGVRFSVKKNRWIAQIKVSGQYKHIGYYNDFNLAVLARKMAEQKYKFHTNHGRV